MDRILVALDSSPRAPGVLAAAVALARKTGAKLRLLRAVALPPELPAGLFASPRTAVLESLIGAARHDLEELAAEVPPELFEGITAQVGAPWETICTYAREEDVDLVVIGSHGYRLRDRILGTTAAKVVNHAERSVLVIRRDEGQS